MMRKWIPALITLVSIVGLIQSSVFAETLLSPNYQLIDPELSSASGTTTSSNYDQLVSIGGPISYGQVSSALYAIGSGQGYTFMANVPKIKCFETNTTVGTTQCTTSTDLFCGGFGCYDRARVEIDTQANPTDTVYSIQISTDNFATYSVIDGAT